MRRPGKILASAALLLAIAAKAAAPLPALMIVGLPHFANPSRDIANTRVESVLTPARQAEIAALVERLAAFRPNHVAVEWPAGEQDRLDRRYADLRAGRRTLGSDESDQIGLRLAVRLGLPRVDAVDWNDEPPGRDADYDFAGWMTAHGRDAEWARFQQAGQAQADAEGAFQRCHPIADWVRHLNDAAGSDALARPYFTIATFGDVAANPGAAWVGAWFARNLRIYGNLLRTGGAAGDRTVAVFGAGHGPLLRSDAAQSGRFAVVDVVSYLPPARRTRC